MKWHKHRGASLVQVVVAIAIFAVLGVFVLLSTRSLQTYGNVSVLRGQLDGEAYGAVAFMLERLRASGTEPAGGLALSDPHTGDGAMRYHRVELRVVVGIDASTGTLLWSPVRAFGFAYQPGEAAPGRGRVIAGGNIHGEIGGAPNGIDDDGDGLVDEGILYYEREDGAGNPIYSILAHNVLPASGFLLRSAPGATTPDPDDDAVLIHLRVAGRDPSQRSADSIITRPEAFLRTTIDAVAVPRNRPAP